jgi:hypothetical protein
MKQIASALVKAQKAFGPALKTATNPHFRSRYADLSACIEAVIDALNDHGIALVQQNSPAPDGVIVETVFIHESGEMLNCGQLFVPASKNDPQGYGSALTYARRYSLMSACGIAPEDDDGNAASRKVDLKVHPKVNLEDHLAAIEGSANSDELTKVYKIAHDACQGDQALIGQIIAAKKKRIEKAKKEQANG